MDWRKRERWILDNNILTEDRKDASAPTLTGGSSPNQYRKSIELPLTDNRHEFVKVDVETGDISDAWELNGNLFNVQKAVHRLGKKAGTSDKYDLDKMLWFTLREQLRRGIISHAEFWAKVEALNLA